MKNSKKYIILLIAVLATILPVGAKHIIEIEGPESSYNQIWLVNQTSKQNFECRVSVLNSDETVDKVYGIYAMKEKGDKDVNTNKIARGTKISIEFPSDLQIETKYTIEYKDFPLFDVVIIQLFDKDKEWK